MNETTVLVVASLLRTRLDPLLCQFFVYDISRQAQQLCIYLRSMVYSLEYIRSPFAKRVSRTQFT